MAEIELYSKPTFLYRYRSIRRNPGLAVTKRRRLELDALTQRYVYCAGYGDMNDPMEGLYKASKRVRDQEDYAAIVEAVAGEKGGLGIASFAETWDHSLMWAHYADGFSGLCVAYNLRRLLHGLPDECALARVRYAESPHSLNLAGVNDTQDRARAVLSTKSVLWSYEREWRLFAPRQGPQPYPEGVVSHVYIGTRMRRDDRKFVEEALAEAGIETRRIAVDGYTVIQEEG